MRPGLRPVLELRYLGHNAWHVRSGGEGFLIDPLLLPRFGNSSVRPFRVHPLPPAIRKEHFGIRNVLLTHEHSDHVDLESLACLPAGTAVHVGPVFPQYLADAIQGLGHMIVRCEYRTRFEIDGVSICLYPCDPATAFWEQRVSQPLLSSFTDLSAGVFMAVDALISLEYLSELDFGLVAYPQAVAISNNSYVMPPGEFGPLDSFMANDLPGGITGLELLAELTHLPPSLAKARPTVLVGGGGIRRFDETLHWPFSDQQELAHLCAILAPDLEYIAPRQGELLTISSESGCNVVSYSTAEPQLQLPAKPPPFSQVVSTEETGRSDEQCLSLLEAELDCMAAAISMSSIGDSWWQANNACEYAAVIVLLHSKSTVRTTLGLRGTNSKFEAIQNVDFEALMKVSAYGLVCFVQDLASVANGEVEIWDVVGKAVKCWHPPGSRLNTLTSFLYAYFGEQVRPNLARSCLLKAKSSGWN